MSVVCTHCSSEVTIERYTVKAREYREALDSYVRGEGARDETCPRTLILDGMPMRLHEKLAVGHSTDVFLAERATRLTERLVLKVLRSPDDEPLLRNEQQTLDRLERSSVPGSAYFTTLLPQRVSFGRTDGPNGAIVSSFREPIGFSHTLLGVRRAVPGGLDPRHLVWLGRRLLELLGWMHRNGCMHNAIIPSHVLVNARDHGAMLVGFSCATVSGERLAVAPISDLDFYSKDVLEGRSPTPSTDLSMLAKTLLWAGAGADKRELEVAPLWRLFERESERGSEDAWALSEELNQVAQRCFGPPRFVPLHLP